MKGRTIWVKSVGGGTEKGKGTEGKQDQSM
jgi:hypothetical protein